MEIPSNSEICIHLAWLINALKSERRISNDREFCAIYDKSEDVLNRLINAEVGSDTPPAWVPLSSCDVCAGTVIEPKLNSVDTVKVVPRSIEFHSTDAKLYDDSLNIEFDNMRMIVGYGRSRRRWLTHDVLCGKNVSDLPEVLKPLWFATYKPIDASKSTDLLRELID